jgi:hypothetical protein
MAQALTLNDGWATSLALATPTPDGGDPAGVHRLPDEWQPIDRVVLDDVIIDHVVVGPNGVFAIALDPDPRPTVIGADGLYRDGSRITTTVKSALMAAYALRARVGPQLFAYPLLVSPIEGPQTHLDRLGVIPPHGIPEAIWGHPGTPLTRTQRLETAWALRSLAQ